jgi:hypothetical protein
MLATVIDEVVALDEFLVVGDDYALVEHVVEPDTYVSKLNGLDAVDDVLMLIGVVVFFVKRFIELSNHLEYREDSFLPCLYKVSFVIEFLSALHDEIFRKYTEFLGIYEEMNYFLFDFPAVFESVFILGCFFFLNLMMHPVVISSIFDLIF